MELNRLERYQKATLIPLVVLALLFLITFLVESFQYSIAGFDYKNFSTINNLIWMIFAIDYIIMFILSDMKIKFIRSHPIELLLVLIPHLRPLRALRILFMFERIIGNAKQKIYISIPYYVSGAALLIVALAAGAIYPVESKIEEANIKSPQDALWWAAVTVTTVGYGDKFPISSEGRWIAVGLMITGIAVVGAITASLAAWIVNKVNDQSNGQPI
jgi:voltage-gated potassium channel